MTDRALHAQLERLELEGLLHEVEGAELHGLDGALDGSVGGHQHHGGPRVAAAGRPQHLDAVGARQPQIGDHDVVGFDTALGQAFPGLLPVGQLVDLAPALPQRPGDAPAQRGVVLDDQDARATGALTAGPRRSAGGPGRSPRRRRASPPRGSPRAR